MLIDRIRTMAIKPPEAYALGLEAVTQPFTLRRWLFAKEVALIYQGFVQRVPERRARFVVVADMMIEVWARPLDGEWTPKCATR